MICIFEQLLTIELTGPLSGYLELGPPDNYNQSDYEEAVFKA